MISWIPDGVVSVHFDATRFDVKCPKRFRKRTSLRLDFGLNVPRPIVDLKIDQEAISGTLSFDGDGWVFCKVPWAAVFCVSQPTHDRVCVWLNDAPEDVQREVLRVAGEEANKKLQRQRLRIVK